MLAVSILSNRYCLSPVQLFNDLKSCSARVVVLCRDQPGFQSFEKAVSIPTIGNENVARGKMAAGGRRAIANFDT